MEAIEINEVKALLPYMLKHKNIWTSFDEEADILYLHFKKPNRADNAELIEDGIIVRYENEKVVGLSIMNASQRIKQQKQ